MLALDDRLVLVVDRPPEHLVLVGRVEVVLTRHEPILDRLPVRDWAGEVDHGMPGAARLGLIDSDGERQRHGVRTVLEDSVGTLLLELPVSPVLGPLDRG